MLGLFRDRTFALSVLLVATAVIFACGTTRTLPPTGCAAVSDCTTAGFPSGTQCLGGYCIPPGTDAGSLPDTGPQMDSGQTEDGGNVDDAGGELDGAPDDAPTSGSL